MAVVERLIAAQDAEHRATAELAERRDAALRRLRRLGITEDEALGLFPGTSAITHLILALVELHPKAVAS